MVLILSNRGDISTAQVVRWLLHWGIEWKRVNEVKPLVQIFNAKLNILDKGIDSLKIHSVWYRRSIFRDERFDLSHDLLNINNNDKKKIVEHIIDEQRTLVNFLVKKHLSNIKSINAYDRTGISKLEQLQQAQDIGLNIPKSFIASKKSELQRLLTKYQKLAIKPLSEVLFLNGDKKDFGTYTILLHLEEIEPLPEEIHPLFVQIYIEKLIEIRSFYLFGKFYSMAMFTQRNKQTSIDFRKYDFKKPTRSVPFKLPAEIEEKLNLFMLKMGLTSGSFDLLVDEKYNFYFLEVNPVGQFGMVSVPCNYYIEKEIANTLAN